MTTPTPPGWVMPEWPSLSRRPLILGLPFPAFGMLLLVVALVGVIMKMFAAGLVLLVALWGVGAALTRYDPYSWEIMLGALRLPKVLRAC